MGLSICIPTYNRLPHLKRLISSIFSGFKDYPFEIIAADGGSTDGTIEYLKTLDKTVLIEQKELKGSVKAYNECFKLAKYDYILWPADDFILIPSVIIKACNLMDRNKKIGLVSPKMQESTCGGLPGTELFITGLVLSKTHIFRKSVLKEINYFDERFRTYAVDDDSSLSVLNLGYSIIFTKETGIIHTRFKDELRKINVTSKKKEYEKEKEYFRKKWESLAAEINKYTNKAGLKKYYFKFFQFICRVMFKLGIPTADLYDNFLERSVFFKAKEYDNLKDFYLAQKFPEELLNKKK